MSFYSRIQAQYQLGVTASAKPVWVVSYRLGRNQEVLAVFSSKSSAEEYKAKEGKPNSRFIEESTLDPTGDED